MENPIKGSYHVVYSLWVEFSYKVGSHKRFRIVLISLSTKLKQHQHCDAQSKESNRQKGTYVHNIGLFRDNSYIVL